MRRAIFTMALAITGLLTGSASASSIVGFKNGSGFSTNGAAAASGNSVTLTQGALAQAGSVFATAKQDVSSFVVEFDYLATAGIGAADGVTFSIQNSAAGASALGSSGGGLGYGGIGSSVAFQINLYEFSAGGRGVAVNSNGKTAQSGGSAYQSTGLALLGSAIHVTLIYDGATLSQTLTDGVNVYATSTLIDITGIVGATDAFVGLTGGTGFESSTQTISNFAFESAAGGPLPQGAPPIGAVPLPPAAWAGMVGGIAVMCRGWRRVG